MLTLEERDIAERAVALAIMSKDKPRAVLLAMVADEDFQMYFPLTPQNAKDLAREAIRMCEAHVCKGGPNDSVFGPLSQSS